MAHPRQSNFMKTYRRHSLPASPPPTRRAAGLAESCNPSGRSARLQRISPYESLEQNAYATTYPASNPRSPDHIAQSKLCRKRKAASECASPHYPQSSLGNQPALEDGVALTVERKARLLLSPSTSASRAEARPSKRARKSSEEDLPYESRTNIYNPSGNRNALSDPGDSDIKSTKCHRTDCEAAFEPDSLTIHDQPASTTLYPDPIRCWAVNQTWPGNFADYPQMSSSNNPGKRPRQSDPSQSGGDEILKSYTQSRREGEVPWQYTPQYEKFIFTKGLDMDILRGRGLVSAASREKCANLRAISRSAIQPSVFPANALIEVINRCQNRNEALVNRDITPLMLPSISSLYFGGNEHLEHVCDEVNTFWYDQCVLAGPRPRPDLAIGFFASAFTEQEIEKLDRYKSVMNLTQFTNNLFFPFLMCEVKCGVEGLDSADRQNMHSCSVAVKAILRIEEMADRYRSEKKFLELNRQVLVFSISHDQKDVRIYGHYAVCENERWSYYRYVIKTFNILANEDDLLAIHSFVQNVLKTHTDYILGRLKDAISALPEITALSFSASDMSINDGPQHSHDAVTDNSKSGPQPTNDSTFRKPDLPPKVAQQEITKMRQQIDKLLELLEEQRQEKNSMQQQLLEQLQQQRQDNREESQ